MKPPIDLLCPHCRSTDYAVHDEDGWYCDSCDGFDDLTGEHTDGTLIPINQTFAHSKRKLREAKDIKSAEAEARAFWGVES